MFKEFILPGSNLLVIYLKKQTNNPKLLKDGAWAFNCGFCRICVHVLYLTTSKAKGIKKPVTK